MKRTQKEWNGPCRNCGGTGTVHKRQTFALWTPEEYEWAGRPPTLPSSSNVPENTYVCEAAPGASINEAVREAIEIASVVKRPVAFEFNGVIAICSEASDAETVVRLWWRRAYGKSYEQSMSER